MSINLFAGQTQRTYKLLNKEEISNMKIYSILNNKHSYTSNYSVICVCVFTYQIQRIKRLNVASMLEMFLHALVAGIRNGITSGGKFSNIHPNLKYTYLLLAQELQVKVFIYFYCGKRHIKFTICNHVKMYCSEALSTFTLLGHHHHHLPVELFSLPLLTPFTY